MLLQVVDIGELREPTDISLVLFVPFSDENL